jgi:hypothetical protein
MKKFLLFFALCLPLAWSCNSTDDINAQQRIANDEINVTYEVTTATGKWFGEYFDATGARIQTSPLEQSSGWKYSFKVSKRPLDLMMHATSSCLCENTPRPDVTVKVYINDQLVKTETNNWAKGVTTAVYSLTE